MFLTAADEETDIIMGLDIGADDYITKPFKLAVFLSRINALLRRSNDFNSSLSELKSGDICINILESEVYKKNNLLELTEQILSRLWDCEEKYIDNNSLTVYIRRLRIKIEDDPGNPKRIITVRGMGYKWNSQN